MDEYEPGFRHYDLTALRVTPIMNGNLDGRGWSRTHFPESVSWVRSRSVTPVGDLVVACVLRLIAVTPSDVLAHIKNTWHKDMKNKPKLKDSVMPLHGALHGRAPPPRPLTMFSHHFF